MVKLKAFVWNEHEEPQEVPGVSRLDGFVGDFNLVQNALATLLEVKEYGKMVRTDADLVLYYRAFTDEFRGRQVVSGVTLSDLDKNFQERKRECALRVLSPAELYALSPITVDYGSWNTVDLHLGGEIDRFDLDLDAVALTGRFETRTLVDYSSDGERTWTLQTVWFDGKPVMVVNSAGRGGRDDHDRWITDGNAFHDLVRFLKSFCPETEETGFVEASAKIPGMTEFYGGTIHDFYDVDKQEPKKL